MGEHEPRRRRALRPRPLIGATEHREELGLTEPSEELFPAGTTAVVPAGARPRPPGLVVRVLPDETAIDKVFDYVVPPRWTDLVEVGTRVRIPLGARRVAGWVVEVGVEPAAGVALREITKVSGHGPRHELIDLAAWARWRWAARSRVPFLRTASPLRNVATIPSVRPMPVAGSAAAVRDPVIDRALALREPWAPAVVRLAPHEDRWPLLRAAAELGPCLIVCAGRAEAARLASRFEADGTPSAEYPDQWDRAMGGARVVVGARAVVWAPVPDLAAVVVLDEHDEVHQEEGSPTWHARDVAVERARRAGVPCILVSPMPSLESLLWGEPLRHDRSVEREGWPATVVVDRRDDDAARNALFSPTLLHHIRSGASTVCVLNQRGRAALLACARCHELARCDRCEAAVHRPGDELVCRRCATTRPVVCARCGGLDLRTVRMGVSRVRDDLEKLTGEAVVEVTAGGPSDGAVEAGARLHVGTEAVLHHVRRADVVAFLDFDQELLAPRYRAGEEALALVVRAARLVGGRDGPGRLLLQTRLPEHEVCRAAALGDPTRVTDAESSRRSLLGLPPFGALAELSDVAAGAFVASIVDPRVQVRGPVDGRWQVRAPSVEVLCDALAAVDRPPGRLRLSVDPMRM